jgi:RNA-binding protein
MPISTDRKKAFRAIGHKLNPIVTIASKGLSEGVLLELNRALDDHELIKVKLGITDREERKELVSHLSRTLPQTELIQEIGKVIILYRCNKNAKPKLSNLHK